MVNNKLLLTTVITAAIIIGILIIFAGGGIFQDNQNQNTTNSTTTTTTTTITNTSTSSINNTTSNEEQPPILNEKKFTIEGTEFSFTPDTITVDKGDKVVINFINEGNVPHNFGISELGVRTRTISSGTSESLEFIVNETGTFDFDCSIPGHRGSGMRGNLIVNGP